MYSFNKISLLTLTTLLEIHLMYVFNRYGRTTGNTNTSDKYDFEISNFKGYGKAYIDVKCYNGSRSNIGIDSFNKATELIKGTDYSFIYVKVDTFTGKISYIPLNVLENLDTANFNGYRCKPCYRHWIQLDNYDTKESLEFRKKISKALQGYTYLWKREQGINRKGLRSYANDIPEMNEIFKTQKDYHLHYSPVRQLISEGQPIIDYETRTRSYKKIQREVIE